MRRRYFTSIIIMLFLLAASCTKENTEDCYSGLELRFTFTHHVDGGEMFGEQVNRVRIYLFDEQGVLQLYALDNGRNLEYSFMRNGSITTISTPNPYGKLPDNYAMRLNVPPGKYKILSWAGSSTKEEPTFFHARITDPQTHAFEEGVIIGETRIEDVRMFIKYKNDPDSPEGVVPVVDEIDDLWYGAVGTRNPLTDVYAFETVDVKSGENASRTVELIRNSNILKVTVTGIEHLTNTESQPASQAPGLLQYSNLKLWAVAKNGRYKYDNVIGERARSIRYVPFHSVVDINTLKAEIKILRLDWESHSILLNMEAPDGKRYPEQPIDVVKTLLQARDPQTGEHIYNSQSDLDKIYEHPIEIRIGVDLNVSIYVNGWQIIDVIPEV